MVCFRNMTSQIYKRRQEHFWKENRALGNGKRSGEKISSLYGKKTWDAITAFQDKNKVAWGENIIPWENKNKTKKTPKPNQIPLGRCQDPTNGQGGGLGENLDWWKIGLDL